MADFGCCTLSEGFDYTIPPFFKDIDFWFWKARMTSFIKAYDFDMWDVFINVFDFKPRRDWSEEEKKRFSLNIRAMKILYSALTENDFVKIKCCSSAKDIWDTLDSMYASNNCVEVDSVDSSSESISCISMFDEQLEVENDEGEIMESFHESVNTEEQEEEDSQEELSVDEYDESLSAPQNKRVVKSSNSSCTIRKNNSESLHKFVLQPIIDSVLKRKSICNYCGKSGHISHTCNIRRNSNMRHKFVWVPKGQVRSSTDNSGPKAKWVPKCPSSASCVQVDSRMNEHKGTKMKKNPRVSYSSRKGFPESLSTRRTLGAFIAGTTKTNPKEKQWRKRTHSTSRMVFHRVPFSYLEENKKWRISHEQSRRLLKSTFCERMLLAPKARNSKFEHHKKMHWVSKGNPLSP